MASELAAATSSQSTADTTMQAALDLFYEVGYHGASIRAISQRAGVGIATLFHHHESKPALLSVIMHHAIDDLNRTLADALDGTADPDTQLATVVQVLVLRHCENVKLSFVAQSELRSLEPGDREAVVDKRQVFQRRVVSIIEQGVAVGAFDTDKPHEIARAIVSMAVMVATWYRPNGAYSPNDVAEQHVHMALRLVGATRD